MISLKKILFIIAYRDFRDAEYFVPKNYLQEKGGFEISVASSKEGVAIGADGGEVNVDILLDEAVANDYDAILFIGGPGCLADLDNEKSYSLARDALRQEKIVGAICIAPVILARAGLLNGKEATVWANQMDKSAVRILEEEGAIYQDEAMVIDGNIITANGPSSAEQFARAIALKMNPQ